MKYELCLDYYPIINECYSEDSDLINKYRLRVGIPFEETVKEEENRLMEHNALFLVVRENDEIVGYFGSKYIYEQNIQFLTTIFVKPKFRTSKYMKEFWELINNYFENKPFMSGVFSKNEPANRFFRRHCSKEIEFIDENENLVNLYWFNLGV